MQLWVKKLEVMKADSISYNPIGDNSKIPTKDRIRFKSRKLIRKRGGGKYEYTELG
jgi:hypothetical protein